MPKTQTTSPTTAHFHHFSPRWSALWAPHQHEPRPHHHQTRGISLHEGPTRRRHTARGLGVEKTRVIGHVVLLWFAPCMPWYALLVRTWACYSEPGQPRPRTEQTAHVRNSGFTCGTRWNPGHCRTQPIHDGSRDSHTQARDAAFTGTRQTRPPTTATFPRRTADKSPPQQHDLSILQVGSHQLQHQLSRINKPKSHHKTNTICPVTQTPTSTSAQAAGGPDCDARGRRQGLAGQRADAPSEARGADGRSGRADTAASRISHAIPPQHESTQAQ